MVATRPVNDLSRGLQAQMGRTDATCTSPIAFALGPRAEHATVVLTASSEQNHQVAGGSCGIFVVRGLADGCVLRAY